MDRIPSEHEALLHQRSYCSGCHSDSEWSESSLSSSCSSSSSNHSSNCNSFYEWEHEISTNGELFFIRSEKLNTAVNSNTTTVQSESNHKSGREESTTDKLARLIRRRNSRRVRKKPSFSVGHDLDTSIASKSVTLSNSASANPFQNENLDQTEFYQSFLNQPFGVMYFSLREISDIENNENGLVYCFPRPFTKNLVFNVKGALITLYQLMSEITTASLSSSSFILKDHLCHTIFTPRNFELMLLTVMDARCNLAEANSFNADIVRYLEFSYQSLFKCFTQSKNHSILDNFFSSVFSRLFNHDPQFITTAEDKISLIDLQPQRHFEELAPAAHYIPLPRDAQVQIDDALSELEANDFSELSDAHFGCQRLFTIVGTCLFHKSYLLATHLNQQDLVDVVSFFRHQGLFDLASKEMIKSMVVWREVFLSSCKRGQARPPNNSSSYELPQGRWFLLIVGLGHEMLCVLLEAGGCTVQPGERVCPDVFYIEQSIATLEHINKIGIVSFIERWLPLYSPPQVSNSNDNQPSPNKSSPKTVEPVLNFSSHSSSSLGKHRSSDGLSMGKVSHEHLLQMGEDTSSSIASDPGSVNQGPVLGRRAQREKAQASLSDSNSHCFDSECEFSDSDIFPAHLDFLNRDLNNVSKFSSSSNEFSLPPRIHGGDTNLIFNFIQLDKTDGILLSWPKLDPFFESSTIKLIMNNFKRSVHTIQEMFENTIRFKKLNESEVKGSVLNNSLIAIKEHGMLFECTANELETTKRASLTYWVVGRLFFLPQPREVYVCHQDSVPQNMVEIAFRIGCMASG